MSVKSKNGKFTMKQVSKGTIKISGSVRSPVFKEVRDEETVEFMLKSIRKVRKKGSKKTKKVVKKVAKKKSSKKKKRK